MVQGRHCMSLFLFSVSATTHFLCLIHGSLFPTSFLSSIFFHDCMPLICSLLIPIWFMKCSVVETRQMILILLIPLPLCHDLALIFFFSLLMINCLG
ncbi:hypothetical protein V8F44DRAFT_583821 [Aspergillus fumigatus]